MCLHSKPFPGAIQSPGLQGDLTRLHTPPPPPPPSPPEEKRGGEVGGREITDQREEGER